MTSVDVPPDTGLTVRRFAVAWRNRVELAIHDVAVLDVDAGTYRFRYTDNAHTIPGFRPFIGFPELRRIYESPRLWPFFDLRVMDRKRPDFAQYVQWLGLTVDADRLDILSRSGGEQKGDTVSVAEAPYVAYDGRTEATFLIRGSGHAVRSYGSTSVADLLQPSDALEVIDDKTNEANPEALLLTARGRPIGWIPDLLIEYVREAVSGGATITLVRNNGTVAPWHMRLLARIEGRVPKGWSAFDAAPWPPIGVASSA